LRYFLMHPCLRADPEDRILPCTGINSPEDPARLSSVRIEQRTVGSLGPMRILDLDYYLGDTSPGPHLRSSLVEESPGTFREIYVARKLGADSYLPPGEVVRIGTRQALRQRFAGRAGEPYVDYFLVSQNAVLLLDMRMVYEAADSAVPVGKMPWHAWSAFSFPDVWRVATAGETGDCCRGVVTVRFRIDDTRAKVTGVQYDAFADATVLRPAK
jgi:hypothetical protein